MEDDFILNIGTFYDPYNSNKGFPGESFDWYAIGIWK